MQELRQLLDTRSRINERISELGETVRVLALSLDQDKKRREQLMDILDKLSVFKPRLTDAVKDALYSAFDSQGHRNLPAIQVKEQMEIRRFDFSNFPHPLASVHSTLRRLADQGSIGSTVRDGVNRVLLEWASLWRAPKPREHARDRRGTATANGWQDTEWDRSALVEVRNTTGAPDGNL
jgi:hypothetical protein